MPFPFSRSRKPGKQAYVQIRLLDGSTDEFKVRAHFLYDLLHDLHGACRGPMYTKTKRIASLLFFLPSLPPTPPRPKGSSEMWVTHSPFFLVERVSSSPLSCTLHKHPPNSSVFGCFFVDMFTLIYYHFAIKVDRKISGEQLWDTFMQRP